MAMKNMIDESVMQKTNENEPFFPDHHVCTMLCNTAIVLDDGGRKGVEQTNDVGR
jgi:hypothetical protein